MNECWANGPFPKRVDMFVRARPNKQQATETDAVRINKYMRNRSDAAIKFVCPEAQKRTHTHTRFARTKQQKKNEKYRRVFLFSSRKK